MDGCLGKQTIDVVFRGFVFFVELLTFFSESADEVIFALGFVVSPILQSIARELGHITTIPNRKIGLATRFRHNRLFSESYLFFRFGNFGKNDKTVTFKNRGQLGGCDVRLFQIFNGILNESFSLRFLLCLLRAISCEVLPLLSRQNSTISEFRLNGLELFGSDDFSLFFRCHDVKSLKVCALVAQKCSYNRTNYTEEEEENKEKSNKRTTIKRIEKAPSIEEANEGFHC